LRGNVSGLTGDVTGLWGDASAFCGNVDDCELTAEERHNGVNIEDLLKQEETT